MADTDWATVRVPVLMAKTIDAFLETDYARRYGITSRADLVMMLLRKFFEDYEDRYGSFVNRDIPPRPKTK